MDYQNWMHLTPAIHGKKLRHICLPASHDSATNELVNEMVPDARNAVFTRISVELEQVRKKIAGVGFIGDTLAKQIDDIQNAAFPAIHGMAKATGQTIAQQLAQGIRGFDLRVFFDKKDTEYYSFHGLKGINYKDILQEIADFMAGVDGEIVFATLGHWVGFGDQQYAEFADLVKAKLGPYAYTRNLFGLGVYESSTSTFLLRNSTASGEPELKVKFGLPGDIPILGNWSRDGQCTIGIFRPGECNFYLSSSNAPDGAITVFPCSFAQAGDIPVAGDWTGKGYDSVGVYRPSNQTFYLSNSNSQGDPHLTVQFGQPGDIPVVGDWSGKGWDSVGVYRPGDQTFHLKDYTPPNCADQSIHFGQAGDIPVTGDWSSSGVTTIGVYRPATAIFHLLYHNACFLSDVSVLCAFARPGDRPLVMKARANNPFNQTYDDIIQQSGEAKSRIILVNDNSSDPVFWPAPYSPPDSDSNNGVLSGYYSNKDNPQDNTASQKQHFQCAIDRDLPFALYMTLTPNGDDAVKIVGGSLSGPIRNWKIPLELATPVLGNLALFSVIKLKETDDSLGWKTLFDLSQRIDKDLDAIVLNNFANMFTGENRISLLYLDFFETTHVVDLAIELSGRNATIPSPIAG